VQSDIEPDWSRLSGGYLRDHPTKPMNLDVSQFTPGRVYQFRLKANPSKRDSKTRKTIGLFYRKDQLDWLQRQAERCGFRLQGVDVMPSPNVFGVKGKGTSPIRITTALYQGILEVLEPEPFFMTLQQGIGRGKSYGCGLLSLARLGP
jgi:CRISPR system Cascade subunit CasE